MIIPYQQLNQDTLDSIIESFILQEGTDYGEHEVSLAQKVSEIKAQLQSGKVVLAYSELHETVTIMPASQFEE